jgi:F-type H+-transporting ATPase subunit epsilon
MAATIAPTTIALELVTPERLVKSEPVEMVVVPGAEGDMGVLPGHALLIGALRPGLVTTYEGGQPAERLFVSGGFVDVSPERCTVLAEEAEPLAEISRDEIEKAVRTLRDQIDEASKEADPDKREAMQNKIAARLRIEEAKLATLAYVSQ